MKTILVTGSAGFIGAFLVKRLLEETNDLIIGLDNLNPYYDVSLKEERLRLTKNERYTFIKGDLADKALIDQLFNQYHFDIVVNLAAQAGVRYSIDHPDVYIGSNIVGFYNILEACRHNTVEHLVGGLNHKGMRIYLLAKAKLFRRLSVNAKIGSTIYSDIDEIGSGLEKIEGNVKTEAKLQIIWKI